MTYCVSCGAENADGTQFCVRCGASLGPAPAPESWRASGDLGHQQTPPAGNPSSGYNPGSTPGGFPTYNPPQQPMPYQQPGTAQPMHPAIPAIVSLIVPGIGLLFVPNKAGLGIGIFAGYIGVMIVLTILAVITFGLGSCLFLLAPLANVAAAIHSWDEAAKLSGGQFQPILFK